LITDIEKSAAQRVYYENRNLHSSNRLPVVALTLLMLNNPPNVEKAVINDINADLTNTYKIIASKTS
jgi:DNA adenine methylase